ncbi:putative aspartic proteinase GIP2 [Silene latifolia]|uniref:putative aspartic proteinase GIP2 n=1 Tax=Silene latifolia TaxID=37657 RepID=UPI003D76AA72
MACYSSSNGNIIKAFLFSTIITTLHVAKGNIDAMVISISKDQTTLQYVAKLQQGTPPMPVSLTVDLGGPFSWVDCSRGYKSSTYGAAQCGLAPCGSFGPEQTCGDCHSGPNPRPGCNNDTCSVIVTNPITGKSNAGEVASDILTVHSTDGSNPGPLVTAHTDFVCSNTGLLKGLPKGANGVVGFGRGRSSLLTQFDNEFSDEVFYFPLKFALCLTSSSRSPGFAIFGKAKYELTPTIIDLSKSLKFSPMIQNPNGDHRSTDYYLNVTAIKINGKIVNLNKTLLSIDGQGNGGTKISTIHPYTLLKTSIYKAVIAAFTKKLRGAKQVQPVHPFGACYETKGLKVPIIDLVLHKQSVSWRIFENNSMVRVNTDVVCLGFVDGGADLRAAIVIGGHQLEENLLEFSVVDGIGFSSLRSKGISCANFNFTTVA